ncbi:hypothetical protein Tco_1230693, partial [Tanacetum coccineum]
LNGADVNGNHVGQSDIMRRSPNDPDLNGQQFCHSDILHVSQTPNMQCGITSVSPITKFNDVHGRSMQRDIVSEAILANVADAVDQHMQDDIILVSSVSNDVDQDIVHDTSHVVAR